MSKISCDVHTCAHNTGDGCELASVRIGGEFASRSSATRCDSFYERTTPSVTDVSSCGRCCDSTVNCHAAQCFYNDRGLCGAPGVDIGGAGASCCGETCCDTFIRK